MKLKLIALLAGLSCVGMVKADLLYWQIDANPVPFYESVWATTSSESKTFAYAQILDSSDSTALDLYSLAGGSTAAKAVAATSETTGTGKVAANIGDSYSGGSFYIVLYDSDKKKIAWTEDISYSSVASYIEETSAAQFNANWTASLAASNFKFVPEPTSGLLMLVGAALLGLRRKRIA